MVENWSTDKRLELLEGTAKDTETDQSVVWVSQLPYCIKEKFLKVSKDLLPEKINLRVTFQKPPSLKTILSRPRALEVKIDGCEPCGHCKLCGNHGKIRTQNMVATSKNLKIKNKTYKINGKLNCKSCGIYVAVCKIPNCQENYVGQTITAFNTRFNAHRGKWVAAPVSEQRDDTAVLDHYRNKHSDIYKNWCQTNAILTGFDQAFDIYFVDEPGGNLTQQEDSWKQRLKSQINRCDIITPKVF